jgi:putative hemolysin
MNGVVALAGPAVGVPQFSRLYREFRHADPAIYPARRLLDAMNICVVVDPDDVARVPAVGPLVVVANHPRFGLDGLAIADAVRRVRSDVKVMVNAFMGALPEIVETAILVPTSLKGKAEALRAAGKWLEQGGTLVVFPAGDVSADWDGTRYVDPPWQVGAVRLAQRHRAHVLPAFVDGGPSSFYARVRAFHPSLAYPLMLREFLAQRDGTITLRFREAVDGKTLAALPADRAIEALRAAVYDGEEVVP